MKIKSIIVGIFFGFLIVLGMAIYKDFGIPWDEPIQRKLGIHTYEYVNGESEKLLKNSDRYYGQHFEYFLILMEKTLGLGDEQRIYEMRHLANYLVFVLGVFFFYLLLHKRFQNIGLALLGSVFLVASPRIFAHSFYNSKDALFLSVFIIAAYFSIQFIEKRNLSSLFLASLTSALLIGTRVMGVVLPILVLDIYYLESKKRHDRNRLVLYMLLLAVLTIAFWPILWEAPFQNFLDSFSYFPQKTGILFFGENLSSLNVPWYYTLGWILVTTPYSYLLLFFVGLWKFIDDVPTVKKEDLLMLGWFVVPLIATIALKSVLHDSWRQMFFIYPPILYFAVLGLAKGSPGFKKASILFVMINLYFVISFMVRNHPHHYVYFNEFATRPLENEFLLDYWGLSYKQGYEYLAKTDKSPLITVYADDLPGETNLLMLSPKDRSRFLFVPNMNSVNYFLTNYRRNVTLPESKLHHEILVDGTRILGIYRLE